LLNLKIADLIRITVQGNEFGFKERRRSNYRTITSALKAFYLLE